MSDDINNRLRLTVAHLEAQRQKAAAAKAETDARLKTLAALLSATLATWAKRIGPRITNAVETTNQLVGEYGIELGLTPTQTPTPKEVRAIGLTDKLLPGLEVAQAVKGAPKGTPAQPMQVDQPRLRIQINKIGGISVSRIAYKILPTTREELMETERFTNEIIDALVASFVNEGVFGLTEEVPEAPLGANEQAGSAAGTSVEDDASLISEKARARISSAVMSNKVSLDLSGHALAALIDERIEQLSQQLPNSEQAKATHAKEVQTLSELKAQITAFLAAAEMFWTDASKAAPVAEAALSFAGGLRNWWDEKHVEISERAFDTGLFTLGLSFCYLAGAGGPLSALVAGIVVKGKPIADAVSKWVEASKEKS